ncbi:MULTISPECIES: hypothetical protein [unclassified Caballeronia]|uniref:hypothetical protein n=1 Tax=unclassified Caballeronia TaxID=2646786 RepID=UPI0020277EAA|nr:MULTISPECIES: hypothetical protein [unclassified Caballeronia]
MGKWLQRERSKANLRRMRAAATEAKAQRRERENAQGSLAMGELKQRIKKAASESVAGRRRAYQPTETGVDEHVRRRIGVLKQLHPDWDRHTCYQQAYRELAPIISGFLQLQPIIAHHGAQPCNKNAPRAWKPAAARPFRVSDPLSPSL